MQWDARLRHSDLDIHGRCVVRGRKSNTDWVCVLAKASHRWSLKINQLGLGELMVGMSRKNGPLRCGFVDGSWYKLGHGHYLVTSHCSVFSHSDAECNQTRSSFKFKKGDILTFTNSDKSLTIHKNGELAMVLGIDAPSVTEEYLPCAYLRHINDAIELLPDTIQ